MPVYVGERYIPEAERKVALEQAARIRSAVMEAAPASSPVRLLSTTFVPNEEWVFDLFEAQSADQVRHIYEVSGVPVERVTEGVHLPGP
jgi:uncharacterized protein DUF4242